MDSVINLEDFPHGLPEEMEEYLGIEQDSEENKKKPITPKVLVEDCFAISVGSFGRYLLKPIMGQAKQGTAYIWRRFDEKKIEFQVKFGDKPSIEIRYKARGHHLTQDIKLSLGFTPFGVRPYLVCWLCGHRGKLYLKPNAHYWACRGCNGLTYDLQTYKKTTVIGFLRYKLYRFFKLNLMKLAVKRIDYAGKYTRKARAVMAFAKNVR